MDLHAVSAFFGFVAGLVVGGVATWILFPCRDPEGDQAMYEDAP